MAVSSIVPKSTIQSTFSIGLPGWDTSINNEENIKISGFNGFRQRLLVTGISERVFKLISSKRGQDSLLSCNSFWSKWANWCSERKINSFRCAIGKVLYLSYLFDSGFEYRKIGCHRSAIFAYHECINKKIAGQHPHVFTLLKVTFDQRPPQPRCVFIWDIQTVLGFIKSQFSGWENLADKVVTHKVDILMTLLSASRALAVHHLDVRHMLRPEEEIVFTFHIIPKSWKYGTPPPSPPPPLKLEFCEYTEDRDGQIKIASNYCWALFSHMWKCLV